jgi:aryl-alcohol dehydrogenase-like predicted oxidoreductase
MRDIELGRSGVRVSRVVFGAMAHGRDPDEARCLDALHAAIDAGVTSIDTAPLYELGRCERRVGRAVAGRRDRVQLLTKVGLRWDDPHGRVVFRIRDEHGCEQAMRTNSRPDSIRVEVERSLRRLGVEVLDVVQIHRPDPDTPIAESIGALVELRSAGKLRAIGVSNFSAAETAQAQAALGTVPLASHQLHYSLLERRPDAGLLAQAHSRGVGVLAYSPLERGLLAGGAPRAASPARTSGDPRASHPSFHPINRARIDAAVARGLVPIARARALTVAQVALAWVLAQPGVSAVVAGASSTEQARANAAAADLELTGTELAAIERAFAGLRLDPHAGLGPRERARRNIARVAAGIRRRLPARV